MGNDCTDRVIHGLNRKRLESILLMTRSTLVKSSYTESGRAEPMKKAKINVFFMAQVQHGFNKIISNGGRAEI